MEYYQNMTVSSLDLSSLINSPSKLKLIRNPKGNCLLSLPGHVFITRTPNYLIHHKIRDFTLSIYSALHADNALVIVLNAC